MNQTSSDQPSIDVSIGRKPIFDTQRRLWGYELFCVGDGTETLTGLPEEDGVAINVAGSAYMGLQQIVTRNKKIIVNFNEKSILENLPYALPSILAAVKVDEHVYSRPALREFLDRLKKDGYLIAVDGFSGQPELASLYQLADILCMEVAGKNRETLSAVLAAVQKENYQLLAGRVEDSETFKLCCDLGFALFEGPFFKTPEVITMRKLSSNQVARFNLLKAIQADEPDVQNIAEVIQSDASISFRLLAYLNSSAFGFPQKVKSIQHALSLLGWRKIKNWLRVILLADVNQKTDTSEWFLLAAQRGKFLELVAETNDFWGFDPESLHLLGLFSLLDTMLGTPMTEVVTFLPLDSKIKSALCREPNNEYLPLLDLAQYLEEGRWAEADTLMQRLNLNPKTTKSEFQAAINWATELTTVNMKQGGKSA